MNIVVFGLSITSSWGNGHATTYRGLIKALATRGHSVTFLERDVLWYRDNRDFTHTPYCTIELYAGIKSVPPRFGALVAAADLVILGSYVPDGAVLADWITRTATGVTAFYDIDTPVTLARLKQGNAEYISAAMIPRFDLYLSFTGGPVLAEIEDEYGSPRARTLYCAVDPDVHAPIEGPHEWELGYIGTYSDDRQPVLDRLLLEPARRCPDRNFVVAGPQYPASIAWPANVGRIEHLSPQDHRAFYGAQRYTLNVTRADMVAAGYSPSVRLFEAAACGVPVISDCWPGLEAILAPGREILIATTADEVLRIFDQMSDDCRRTIAAAARRRVLDNHTADHRARELESYFREVIADAAAKDEDHARTLGRSLA